MIDFLKNLLSWKSIFKTNPIINSTQYEVIDGNQNKTRKIVIDGNLHIHVTGKFVFTSDSDIIVNSGDYNGGSGIIVLNTSLDEGGNPIIKEVNNVDMISCEEIKDV